MPAWYYQVLSNQGQRHCQEPHHSIPGQNPPIRRNKYFGSHWSHFLHTVSMLSRWSFLLLLRQDPGWLDPDWRLEVDVDRSMVDNGLTLEPPEWSKLYTGRKKPLSYHYHCTLHTEKLHTVHWQKKLSQLKCRRSPRSSKAHQRWFAQMTLDNEERVSQKNLFTLENSIFIFNALRGLPETYQKTIFVKSNDNLLFGRTKGERELFVSKSLRIIFPPVSISPPLLPLKLWLDFWPQTEGSAGSWRAWIDPFQDRDIRSREWYKKVQGGGTRGYEGNKSTCRASIRRIHPPGWSCPIKCLKCGRPALVRQSGSQDGLSPIFPEEVFVPWPTSPAPITEKLSTNSTFMFPYYYTTLFFKAGLAAVHMKSLIIRIAAAITVFSWISRSATQSWKFLCTWQWRKIIWPQCRL